METVLSVCLGLALAAACGLRVFVPLLAVGVAARLGVVDLTGNFAWIGSAQAVATFGVATVAEVVAYHVPWLDNLLDAAASPTAVVAGVLVAASVMTGVDPLVKWTLAVVAGGGMAGSVQAGTVALRQLSSLGTGGLANPVIATLEAGGAIGLAVAALLVPALALLTVVALLAVVWRLVRRRRRLVAAA